MPPSPHLSLAAHLRSPIGGATARLRAARATSGVGFPPKTAKNPALCRKPERIGDFRFDADNWGAQYRAVMLRHCIARLRIGCLLLVMVSAARALPTRARRRRRGKASNHTVGGPAARRDQRPAFYRILLSGAAVRSATRSSVPAPPMTRNWPMKDTPGEEHDHPHHRSFWCAHGDDQRPGFLDRGEGAARPCMRLSGGQVRREVGVIRSRNKRVAADGTLVCADHRTMRFYNRARQGPDD